MSEARFTKGPWIFRKCPSYGISISAKDGGSIIGAMECQNTAFLEIDDDDAHLIAAAPELYEALDACLGLILNQEMQDGFESQQGHMARSALTKARGETP